MSKLNTVVWTFIGLMLVFNTWSNYERIKSNKELNGSVLTFKRVIERLDAK